MAAEMVRRKEERWLVSVVLTYVTLIFPIVIDSSRFVHSTLPVGHSRSLEINERGTWQDPAHHHHVSRAQLVKLMRMGFVRKGSNWSASEQHQ
jgi:hypothetical protein